VIMSARENVLLVRLSGQSYQQRHLGASRRNGLRSENFLFGLSVSEILQRIFNMP
jgi:hypothetical protein